MLIMACIVYTLQIHYQTKADDLTEILLQQKKETIDLMIYSLAYNLR